MEPHGLQCNYQNEMFLLTTFGFFSPSFIFSDPVAFTDVVILAWITQGRTLQDGKDPPCDCFIMYQEKRGPPKHHYVHKEGPGFRNPACACVQKMGRRAVGRIQSALWSREDRLYLVDVSFPSLHNPVLAGCQVYRYCPKGVAHAPGLWSCSAGTLYGTSFSSGAANADQSPLTPLLGAHLGQDVNMSYLVQPDVGAAVTWGSHHVPLGYRPLCPPLDGGASSGAKALFFSGKMACPT